LGGDGTQRLPTRWDDRAVWTPRRQDVRSPPSRAVDRAIRQKLPRGRGPLDPALTQAA